MTRRVFFEDVEQGQEWSVVYDLGQPEVDDDFSETNTEEIVFYATSYDRALMYAQQYIRKKLLEDSAWEDARILSINLR